MTRNKYLAIGAVFCVCLFHVLAVMGYLVREGRLSMVPVYDDVTYLIDGLSRLAVLDRAGIGGFVADLRAHSAHAPFMAATSAFGFLLSGGAVWGPYLLNSLWVFLVAALALQALRDIPVKSRVGIVVALIAVPLFGAAIAEFRPDPVWGLLVGFSVVLLVSVDIARATRLQLLTLGFLIGAAIIAKPSAAPASLAVISATYLTQLGSFLLLRVQLSKRALVRNSLLVALGAAVFVVPYAITSGAETYAYIKWVMGTSNSVWRTETSTLGHITYYLNRSYGPLMLGWVWYVALPILLLCLGLILRAKDRRDLCAFTATVCGLVVAYIIVTVSSVKSPMIGSILYGTIIAAVTWALGRIVFYVPIRGVLILLIGAGIFCTQWIPKAGMVSRTDAGMRATDQATKAVAPVVLEALGKSANKRGLVTVPGPVFGGTLDFLAKQEGMASSIRQAYALDSLDKFQEPIQWADVIILSESGMLGQSNGFNFPSIKFQAQLLQLMRGDATLSGHPVFTDEQGRSVWVFIRK
ncbi:hypothetical protein [Variovorax arabinosiphilus]|uniref:hypothetical protein n=1 Tax=Variovorax arabinosiphilus TaxID=3053498 RepID=UPI0025779B60|nr:MULTISPECIES: hypothetical protein [unclassified Variovorax]MDM0122290.1 hypothetical protein [Variovorax sp. J2L1-78]MDM0131181.1 hypothetical protein [Variovorax sp. J2L1-63]MDM0235053.1 hypothetical protein [Variovorax sp. J2R1-6]